MIRSLTALGRTLLAFCLTILVTAWAPHAFADITPVGSGTMQDSAVVIPIQGTIEPGVAAFVKRALADHSDATTIILDVDTFGGRVDSAVQIRDAVLGHGAPVVAYVNRRAISAGALISLAADQLVFAPGSTMGAATPIQVQGGEATPVDEKMTSYFRAEMRATAEATGRSPELAEAMVDAKVTVDGVVGDGTLLTVSTEEALELKLADGDAASLNALLGELNLADARLHTERENWAETVTRIVTEPTLAGMLMSIGLLAVMLELYSPGFGFLGLIGVTSLSLVFAGHMIADLAGFEEALLLLAGLIALGIELFVLPGFGLAGAIGIACVFAAMVLSMIGLPLNIAWDVGLLGAAISRSILILAGTLLGLILAIRFFPRRALPRGLILDASLGGAQGDEQGLSGASTPDYRHLVGKTGSTLTPLRPSGKARIDGELVDVVTELGPIAANQAIRVETVDGVKIVVTETT